MEPLARTVRRLRAAGRSITLPYVMVDRSRGTRLGRLLGTLADAGAAGVELGFPFSDPIADGPTLEAAADAALRHGTRWADLLSQAREASSHLPVAVMTYANPVWRHGLDGGLGAIADAGATGLIVPDLSLEESGPWARACRRHGLALSLLAAPAATPERVGRIARASSGFLYLVSRYGTTGRVGPASSGDLAPLVRASHRASPDLPVLVGFGIRDAESARRARASGADGVIVGTALEERLEARAPAARIAAWFRGIAAT